MALLLTAADLRPLTTDPELIRAGLDTIAASLAEDPTTATLSWQAFPLAEGEMKLNVNVMTTAANATRVLLWPTDRKTAPDAALSLLFDRSAGRLRALLAGPFLLWRTAGPVLVAAEHLAPDGAETLAMLGSGVQARQHLIGLRQAVPSLRRIRVFSRAEANRNAYAADAARSTGLDVSAVGSVREAVAGADIVCDTAGSLTPLFEPGWIRPGALVTEIFFGVPRDLPARTIHPAKPVPVPPSPFAPHPEAKPAPAPDTTLAAVVAGAAPARLHPDQTVVYTQLGAWPWDTALTAFAYQWAVSAGVGTEIDLSA